MKAKLELKKVKKLVKEGYIPIANGSELLYVVKGGQRI